MATHSSILAWRIPWTEEPGGLQPTGSQSDTTEGTWHAYTTELAKQHMEFNQIEENFLVSKWKGVTTDKIKRDNEQPRKVGKTEKELTPVEKVPEIRTEAQWP